MTKRPLVLDLETTAIDDVTGNREVSILGFGLVSSKRGQGFKWTDENKTMLLKLVESGQYQFIFHNASFDIPVLRRHGVNIKSGDYDCTQVMSWVLNPTLDRYGLDFLCRHYGIPGKFEKPDSWEEWTEQMSVYCVQDCRATLGLHDKVKALLVNDPKAVALYENIERPYIECIIEFEDTGFLIDKERLTNLITELEGKRDILSSALERITGPVPGAFKVEDGSYVVDPERCTTLYEKSKQVPLSSNLERGWVVIKVPLTPDGQVDPDTIPLGGVVQRVNKKTATVAVEQWVDAVVYDGPTVGSHQGVWPHCKLQEFNPNSSAHLGYLLYKRFEWKARKFTKTKLPKTDDEELAWVRDKYELVDLYLQLTDVNKMLSSFLYNFRDFQDSRGYVHSHFNQTGTLTGRLSSSQVNLQNIPTDGPVGHAIRCLVIPEEGWDIVGIDLSNIEGRVLAHYLSLVMNDKAMANIFIDGLDFHSMNVVNWGLLPGYTYEQIRDKVDAKAKEARGSAKTLLYACVPMHTQALTPSGWKGRHDLHVGDIILGYNPVTGQNEWTTIEDFTPVQYGEVQRLSVGKHFQVEATHNHRWYGSRRVQSGHASTSFRYTKDIVFTTEDINSEYIIKQTAPTKSVGSGLCLHRLINKYTEDDLWPSLILQMSLSELWVWFSTNIATDGHMDKFGQPRFSQNYEKQPGLLEAMYTAGYLLGYTPTKHIKGAMAVVCYGARQTRTMQKAVRETLPEQEVWCPVTALGSWVMRQGDTITITGNCLYGAGPEKLGAGDKEKGKSLMATLEKNAPAISALKQAVWDTATQKGGVIHDQFGRRLVYPCIDFEYAKLEAVKMIEADDKGKLFSHNAKQVARMLQSQAQRQVFNALLQGTAASVLKIITLRVFKMRDELSLRTRFAAPVHDELQMYSPEYETPLLKEMLENEFSNRLLTHCPIEGEAQHGKSWGETH